MIIAVLTLSTRAVDQVKSALHPSWCFHAISEQDVLPIMGLAAMVNDASLKLRLLSRLEKECGNILVHGNVFLDKAVCAQLINSQNTVILIDDVVNVEELGKPVYWKQVTTTNMQTRFIQSYQKNVPGLQVVAYDEHHDFSLESIKPGFTTLVTQSSKGAMIMSSTEELIRKAMADLGLDDDGEPSVEEPEAPVVKSSSPEIIQEEESDVNSPSETVVLSSVQEPEEIAPPEPEVTVPEPEPSVSDSIVEGDVVPVWEKESEETPVDEAPEEPKPVSTPVFPVNPPKVIPQPEAVKPTPTTPIKPPPAPIVKRQPVTQAPPKETPIVKAPSAQVENSIGLKIWNGKMVLAIDPTLIPMLPIQNIGGDDWIMMTVKAPDLSQVGIQQLEIYDELTTKAPAKPKPVVKSQPKVTPVSTAPKTTVSVPSEFEIPDTLPELVKVKVQLDSAIREARAAGDSIAEKELRKRRRAIRNKINTFGQ